MPDVYLARLAEQLKRKNKVDNEIAALIGRPTQLGHVGEYIAARVFGIILEDNAAHKASDGRFASGPSAGRSVNIKWYTKHDGLLDMTPAALPDEYLVLSGPKAAAISSRGGARPWVIASVYLFDAHRLHDALQARGSKIGIATSVPIALWNERLVLTDQQRTMLALFRPVADA